MMSRHFFLVRASSMPSARWNEAFPQGVCVAAQQLSAEFGSDALLWLSTAEPGWQDELAALTRAHEGVRIIALAEMPDEDEALQALELGARGYCHARAVPSLLREAALAVEHGGLWVGPTLLARFLGALRRQAPVAAQDDQLRTLSVRELEVARAVAEGLANKEVAARLGIGERTVKAHLGAVFDKLGVRDRLQLALQMRPAVGMEQGERRDLHQV